MNNLTLKMILKIREWEEELEKQKYVNILSTMKSIENQINYLEKRLQKISDGKKEVFTPQELHYLYNEIDYLVGKIEEARDLLNKIEEEVEKQREVYEESIKERKKIERLKEKSEINLIKEREKKEVKIISNLLSVRQRSI